MGVKFLKEKCIPKVNMTDQCYASNWTENIEENFLIVNDLKS